MKQLRKEWKKRMQVEFKTWDDPSRASSLDPWFRNEEAAQTGCSRLSQSSPILDVTAVGPRCQIIWLSSTWLVCCCIPVHAGEEVMAIRRASLGNVLMSFPGFPDGSAGEESICSAGDTGSTGSIHGSVRSPGRGNGNPLQYSCLRKIPWTEEPSELQSTGSQRIGHD